jgi:hypothetical protein
LSRPRRCDGCDRDIAKSPAGALRMDEFEGGVLRGWCAVQLNQDTSTDTFEDFDLCRECFTATVREVRTRALRLRTARAGGP